MESVNIDYNRPLESIINCIVWSHRLERIRMKSWRDSAIVRPVRECLTKRNRKCKFPVQVWQRAIASVLSISGHDSLRPRSTMLFQSKSTSLNSTALIQFTKLCLLFIYRLSTSKFKSLKNQIDLRIHPTYVTGQEVCGLVVRGECTRHFSLCRSAYQLKGLWLSLLSSIAIKFPLQTVRYTTYSSKVLLNGDLDNSPLEWGIYQNYTQKVL